MGNFDDTKPKPAEEILKEAMEALDDVPFKMACFVDCFKRYMKAAGMFEDDTETKY